MEYRVNFCWENPARDFHRHIVSIPWNDETQACFPKSDVTYITEKWAQGTTPGVPVNQDNVLAKLAYLYVNEGGIYDKLQLVRNHIADGDNVIAWIEHEDQHEFGEKETYKTMYEIRLGDKCYVKGEFTEHMLDFLVSAMQQFWNDRFHSRLRGLDNSPLSYCIERLEIGAWDRAYEGKANEKEVHDACVQLLKDCPNNVPELRLVVYNISE